MVVDQIRPRVSVETAPSALVRKGDKLFYAGCIVCGTWLLGPIGAALIAWGLVLLRRAERRGESIRPWLVTIVGGLILVDSAVNYLAWGLDFFPSHDTLIGRTLWVDYGRLVDGGYMLNHNTTSMGGTAVPGEKAIAVASILLVFPLRIAAAWGFLKMKRWGFQWTILGNWLYLCLWLIYAANMSLQFPLRFGPSDFGVLGFWLFAGIPFTGPIVMLPLLHTMNRDLWTD